MPALDTSIHRATISLSIPTKVADLLLYANDVVQKRTNNPGLPRGALAHRGSRHRALLPAKW